MASVLTVPAQPLTDCLSKFLMILFAPYPGGFSARGVDPYTAVSPWCRQGHVAQLCDVDLSLGAVLLLVSSWGVLLEVDLYGLIPSSGCPKASTLGNSLGRSECVHVLRGFCNVVRAVEGSVSAPSSWSKDFPSSF